MYLVIISLIILAILSYSILYTGIYRFYNYIKTKRCDDTLFLTFDDGPDPSYTNKLMDLLNKYNIKVTFFVVANFAKNNRSIIERMKMDGHEIALHSLEHKNALWQTPSYTKYDFEKSISIMNELGVSVKTFRPPWGAMNIITKRECKKYNLKLVIWDVMAEDWRGNTTWQIIRDKLLRRTKGGSIICLHDGRGENEAPSRTIKALEEVLKVWVDKGYKFKLMKEYDN